MTTPTAVAAPGKQKLGECCPVMSLVLTRDTHANSRPKGFSIGQMFNMRDGKSRQALIYQFNKAKRTDLSKHGAKSEYAGTTYAEVKHCPFCGATL